MLSLIPRSSVNFVVYMFKTPPISEKRRIAAVLWNVPVAETPITLVLVLDASKVHTSANSSSF